MFSFIDQVNYINNNPIKYIMPDTTFSTNNKNLLLTAFFTLDGNERSIPLFYILTSSEASDILAFC